MTAAVCVACGASKTGAWTGCPRCGHTVKSDLDRARAVLLSDRYLDAPALAAASAEIEAGRPVELDEAQVLEIAEALARTSPPSTFGLGIVIVGFITLLGAVGLMVFLVLRWLIGAVT